MAHSIRNYRLARYISLADMAEILGISKSMLSMVENERRSLPEKAALRFQRVLESDSHHIAAIRPSATRYQGLKNDHYLEAKEYLDSYRKDCDSELHRLTKLLSSLEKRFMSAYAELKISEIYVLNKGNGEWNQEELSAVLASQRQAEAELNYIASLKPEIIQLRIEGLNQQLRSIKKMMAKSKPHFNFPEASYIKLPEDRPPEIDNEAKEDIV